MPCPQRKNSFILLKSSLWETFQLLVTRAHNQFCSSDGAEAVWGGWVWSEGRKPNGAGEPALVRSGLPAQQDGGMPGTSLLPPAHCGPSPKLLMRHGIHGLWPQAALRRAPQAVQDNTMKAKREPPLKNFRWMLLLSRSQKPGFPEIFGCFYFSKILKLPVSILSAKQISTQNSECFFIKTKLFAIIRK